MPASIPIRHCGTIESRAAISSRDGLSRAGAHRVIRLRVARCRSMKLRELRSTPLLRPLPGRSKDRAASSRETWIWRPACRLRYGTTAETARPKPKVGQRRLRQRRSPSSVCGRFQTPGKSGGEAGNAALTSAKAACKAASLVWSREVFNTVPPSPLSRSRTLSAVTLRTRTKSAAVPG